MPIKSALKLKNTLQSLILRSDVLEITTLLANPCRIAPSVELTLDHPVLRLCGKAAPS